MKMSAVNSLSRSLAKCSAHFHPQWKSTQLLSHARLSHLSIRRTYSQSFNQLQSRNNHVMNPISQSIRTFSTTCSTRHGHVEKPKPGEERRITFIDKSSTEHSFDVADGANLLDIAQAHDLEMEGACGGSCACSTCHVIVASQDMYERLDEPSDDENDMLDLAFGLTETSRLGCQVVMTKDLDGLVVRLPAVTRNLQKSDFEEKQSSSG